MLVIEDAAVLTAIAMPVHSEGAVAANSKGVEFSGEQGQGVRGTVYGLRFTVWDLVSGLGTLLMV